MDFDPIAPAYAAHRRADPVLVAAILDGGAPRRALELGCGTGNYAIALHEATGAHVAGIEPSGEMLAVARGRSSNVEFVQGVAEALPFADAGFDLVFSVDVAHQVDDFEATVREAFRVLEPGGRLVVVTDDEDTIRGRLHAEYFPDVVGVELARYPTPARIRAALDEAGFVGLSEQKTETPHVVTDAAPHRDKAFSSLHLIPEDAFARGLERLERDLERGPLEEISRKLVVRARKP